MLKRKAVLCAALFAALTTGFFCEKAHAEEYVKTTYMQYMEEHAGVKVASSDVVINAAKYSDATADVDVRAGFGGIDGDALIIGESGYVEWAFDIPESGMYNISALYYPVEGKGNAIERMLSIDGKTPFSEASYILFSRVWVDSENIRKDGRDNDIRPKQMEAPEWREQSFYDSLGYYDEPLLFYFEKGSHTLRLTASREPLALRSITVGYIESPKSYAEIKEEYARNGYKTVNTEPIKVQAEKPYAKSEFTNYPVNDRSSAATEPQDSAKVRLNAIGGVKWKMPHQWVSWKITVPEDGLYKLAFRYKQNFVSGMFTSRRLTIDGKTPFLEADSLTFPYSTEWQVLVPGNDEGDYLFYLTKGEHELALEVILGDMSEIVAYANDVLGELNVVYRNILMITGPDPDLYRDYFFDNLIADDIENMNRQKLVLEEITRKMQEVAGEKGEQMIIVDKLIFQLESMYADHEDIAKYFTAFRDNLAAFATWNLTLTEQPLMLDYIEVLPENAKPQKAEASFFEALLFNFMSFFRTFFEDYNTLGSSMTEEEMRSEDTIEVWLAVGRDQMQIVRDMINDNFTPTTNINVNLKLVAAGTLLPSVLAGIGPDVSLSNASGDAVQYALRHAVIPLNDMDGFAEVASRFHSSALIPYELEGKVYALPETQIFPMMFYRKDIFTELGLTPPETWADFYSMVTELQKKNMQTGFPKDINGLLIFLYQQGGSLYNEGLTKTTLDQDLSVECFQQLVELFTAYKLPRDVDFANRFRTGEMPVGIYNYDFYNTLIAFAPEIRGMWEFTRIPGTVQADGSVKHTVPTSGTSIMMLSGAENVDYCWEFMKWYTSADTQSRFGNEMQAVLGQSAKQSTANMEALSSMPWTQTEYANLMSQWENIQGTPEVPGGYYVTRAFDFAAVTAYLDGDPEAILNQVKMANREIHRKRVEFGLEEE